jgi:hypothetical protein
MVVNILHQICYLITNLLWLQQWENVIKKINLDLASCWLNEKKNNIQIEKFHFFYTYNKGNNFDKFDSIYPFNVFKIPEDINMYILNHNRLHIGLKIWWCFI